MVHRDENLSGSIHIRSVISSYYLLVNQCGGCFLFSVFYSVMALHEKETDNLGPSVLSFLSQWLNNMPGY